MMISDDEGCRNLDEIPVEEQRTSWVVPAMRRQNRLFGTGVLVFLLGLAIFVVVGIYNNPDEQPVEEYDAQNGVVGDGADNAKVQEAMTGVKQKHGHAAGWYNGGGSRGNPFDNHNVGEHGMPDWMLNRRNHTDAHNAYLNRTHGGNNHRPSPFGKSRSPSKSNPTHQSPGGGKRHDPRDRPHNGAYGIHKHNNESTQHSGTQQQRPSQVQGDDEHTQSPVSNTKAQEADGGTVTSSGDYSQWLAANVSKMSGVMYEIVEQVPHDSGAFTQGLTYANGILYESTGLYGKSTVRRLDPVTGVVQTSAKLSRAYFGEGMTVCDNKLIQITWKSKTGFVWDANDLTIAPVSFPYKTSKNDEGWGITYDASRNELIVSDGSENLIFWNPKTYEILRTVQVTRLDGSLARQINELEFWRGRVLANIWHEDVLLVINPDSGVVEKEYDFTQLWPHGERPSGTDTFNGISISDDPDAIYVTGKQWNRMYKIKLLP